MNDAELDAAIEDRADLDRPGNTDEHRSIAPVRREHRLDAQRPLAVRWWLASSAFPLTAGTFGPMANAFSVCSLAQTWQIATTKDGTYVDIADPSWITALNALAIAFALISNLALSLNMARRVRFGIAQPVIIVGWYLSSLLLIGQLIAFDVLTHRPENSGHIYTQAYFYGAFAAGIYFIIASMLVMTAYGAHRGYYSREYKLTTSQRTLMLQTITFCIYLLGGAAVYSKIEGWRFLDAVWWADYTLLTVGVGNFVPITHLGRGLLFPYAIGGIVILGLIISSIRRLMLEYGRQKVADALTARTRRFLVKEAFSDHHHLRGLVPHLGRSDVELSDREQQKREFITMRRIRQLATAQHKWISLVVSMAVWMMIWLVGAVVFWRSEHNLRWSYFDALFFAYTTLLTIGYGNRSPVSNLGKSFFVIWSLLAVPITTILISNLGDTLIRLVRDTTLFIGEVTILPGDQSFSARIRDMFRISWTDKWLQEITGERNDTQDVLDNNEPDSLQVESDVRGSMEAEEHKKEETAHQLGDVAAENVHHYHYLLFREIRKMMEYATSNLSKEFDYLEWEYYLALISGKQRPVPADVDASAAGETESVDRERELAYKEWSWIDKKNPLLGGKSEVEWLLHALTDALERELRTASRAYHSPAASDEGDQGSGFASSSSGSGV